MRPASSKAATSARPCSPPRGSSSSSPRGPEVRAERRVRQENGLSYAAVLQDILRRDYHDMTRTAAPLIPARDAIEIDTTELTIHQVVGRMATAYRERTRESTSSAQPTEPPVLHPQ
ncbi:(d)CMP kinase [Amycolatopsis thailandensis]|uniref:(d)CMP kinase n=1 Tax=Amycolatopsis thailandensis TaxID=589330 RepID=UPI00362B4860